MTEKPASAIPVAVVGMSAIYPGYSGLDGYWRTITSGRDAISEVPPSHWLIADYYDPDPSRPDHTYCRRGGFIDPVAFDPMQFGLPPNALPATDSAQLLALIAAKEALDRARRGNAVVDPDRISVVLGVASTTELVVQMGARLQHPIWRKALLENGIGPADADAICADIGSHYAPWQESTFPGLLGNVVAGRIANRLDLGGSNYVTDAACASSLSALQVALHELYLDEADMVLTGGVDALNDIMMFMCFSKTPAFSPTGDCRPFSDAADGTIIGEGVGMLALKRLADAERDGDKIHAVIRGLGSSSDGRASSVYAPRSEGQAKALRRAYERAGYAPSTVGLLEAHGTATKAGDVAEFAGLASVFTDEAARCALGSVKSQIGHTKAAAGAAGLIKAVLSLQHATLPGTLKVGRPNDAVAQSASPFYVNAETRPWVHHGQHPRRASVSSFGFGGSNFHVTLEAYEGAHAAKRLRALPSELVLLSASSVEALATRCAEILQGCARGETLAFLAASAAAAFDAQHEARAGIVATDAEMLREKLGRLLAALKSGDVGKLIDPDIALGLGAPRTGKTAFVFPGQGSQYVGMGGDLALAFPGALAVWDAATRAEETAGLGAIVFPEPAFDDAARAAQAADLTAMANAQPAIAVASLAQLALLDRLGVCADAFAGHSFGEVAALAAAGVLSRERLPAIARMRGVLMTEAAGDRDGAMLAVALSAEDVTAFLAEHASLAAALVIANDNAPTQIVLAGESSDIEAAEALFKAARVTAFRLPVASAFHSSIVASSVAPFAAHLKSEKFAKSSALVFANATAAPYGRGPAGQLADQLQRPVRFREMILAMAAAGVTRFIEVGPGRILTGLIGQILADAPHLAVALDDRRAGGLRGWHRGLAALAADGVALDLAALFAAYEVPTVNAPAPAHAVMVGGANIGKPYPPADGKVTITPRRQLSPLASPPSPAPAAQLTPASASTAATPDISGDAWSLIDKIQSETVEQHRHYLDVMAQSHQSFLDMSAQMLAQITGSPGAAITPRHLPSAAPVAAPLVSPVMVATVAPTPASVAPAATWIATTQPVVPPEEIVLSVVSEKTGYPVDMLGLDMEMEAELGIDSIKQVEILSALKNRYPGAPEIPASELSSLKTLRDVAMKIGSLAIVAPVHAPLRPSMALDPAALQQSVLAIVAEKTGYPVDMLGLDMEMEAELGIDSIKQVEILSALQTQHPGAPEIPASELSTLKTLRQVAAKIGSLAVDPEVQAPPPSNVLDPATLQQSVLAIVAEKTGYPVDMLGLDMEMEAELGIDSIKQVEILSALQDRWPDAPDVAPAELGGLKTLRDVARALTQLGAAAPTLIATPSPSVAPAPLTVVAPILMEAAASGFAMAGLRDADGIYVSGGDARFAGRVVAELGARGLSARAGDPPDGASAVISLSALSSCTTAEESLAQHLEVFRHAQAVARSKASTRFFVAVERRGADPRIPSGVTGIVRTAAREWENASVRAVAMEEADATRLVEELLAGGAEIEVVLRRTGRFVVVDQAMTTTGSGAIHPHPGGVVLVSGGGRGVTAVCAIELAARHGLKLAFFGRTNLDADAGFKSEKATGPEIVSDLVETAKRSGRTLSLSDARHAAARLLARREIEATLATAKSRDIEARYFTADARDAARLREIAQQVRAGMGPIVGVIHGAGVLADKRIADLEAAQFQHVFDAKVAGVEALLAATQSDDLQFLALFSSIAARAGNAGQAAYAAANAVLNAIAAQEAERRGTSCAVRAFGWGPWDGGMVDAVLKRHFERAGVGVISLEEGANFFAAEAVHRGAPVVVVAAPAAAQRLPVRLEWAVSAAALPPLRDHMVQGRIVLPIAVVLERILRAARGLAPSPDALVTIRDLQVLSGVTIAADEEAPTLLSILFEDKDGGYAVTIRDAGQRPRYRAVVEWAQGNIVATELAATQTPWQVSVEGAYEGPLFHGSQFAALARLEEGGAAQLKSLADLGWPLEAWAMDPAAIDGGLQLGLLWAHGDKRALMLPQKIAAFTQVSSATPGVPMRCRLAARSVSDKRVDFDLVFETMGGEAVALLTGAEFYAVGATQMATP